MNTRRAFTLIELVSTMVVLGVVALVAAPVVLSASDAYADASDRREAAERVSAAMERIVRLLREAPPTVAGDTTPGVVSASADAIEFTDGSRLELLGATLWITTATDAAAPLCAGVEAFALNCLGGDGVTDTSATPTTTQRIGVTLRSGGVEMRTAVFLRCGMGAAS